MDASAAVRTTDRWRVLEEEPVPLKIVRNYPPYHEARDVREARAAIVELRLSGWSVKAIAGCLGVHHSTVYRTLERWKEKGFEGLSDETPGRPPGVRKADFAAVLLEVRKPTLFETLFVAGQMRLFGLAETLGEDGWLKALRLEDYALRSSNRPKMLQQLLFGYTDAV